MSKKIILRKRHAIFVSLVGIIVASFINTPFAEDGMKERQVNYTANTQEQKTKLTIPSEESPITGDPLTDPRPIIHFKDPTKKLAINSQFYGRFDVAVKSIEVIYDRKSNKKIAPDLIRIKAYDINGVLLEEVSDWHPLWTFVEAEKGKPWRRELFDVASVAFTLPFRSDVAQIKVIDVEAKQEIIDVDPIPAIHEYCSDNPDDPDCTEIVNRGPTCNAGGSYVAECTGKTTAVTLNGVQSADPDHDPLQFLWTGVFGTASGATPDVAFSNVGISSVGLTVSDGFGESETCNTTATVQDTMPPSITSASASPNQLWSPNNKMLPVSVEVAAVDSCTDTLVCEITTVTSNEPANGKEPDWEITGELSLNLRAERSGKGSDRIYTINVQCMDNDGNNATSTTTVTVPHDQR